MLFDSLMTSLPLHPLVVHAVVIFLTVVPLLVLVSLVWRGLRDRLDWLLPVAALVGAISGIVTKETGEDLEHSLPKAAITTLIHNHTEMGDIAGVIGLVFFAAVVAWWLTTSKVATAWVEAKMGWVRKGPWPILAIVAVALVSVVTLVLVVLAGHSGATAVWTTD